MPPPCAWMHPRASEATRKIMLMDQVSLRILAGEIQVPPGVVPSFPVAVKKDPTIEHFHNEKLTADP